MTSKENSAIKILVVDDEPNLLQIAERLLKKKKYSVYTATSGQGCLNGISANKPDLLILDVMLPDINGIEICKTIKNNPRLASIYIFLISGFKINTESISEGLELGADGYLIKPIQNRELLARIEAAVRIIRTEKALRESEEKYRNLFEYMEEGFLQADVDGVITLANNAMAKMFDYNSPDEMLGMLTLNLFSNSEERAALMKEIEAYKKIDNYEILAKTKKGNELWVLGNYKEIYNQKGERIGTEGLFRDITERKQAEEKNQNQLNELKRYNSTMVDREIKMIQLKQEINDYCRQLNLPEKYLIPTKK
jgi:PAS domain S-box-containing protein